MTLLNLSLQELHTFKEHQTDCHLSLDTLA